MKVPDRFPLDGDLKLGYCENCDFTFNISKSKKEDYFNYYKNYSKHRPRIGYLEIIDREYYLSALSFIENNSEFKVKNSEILDFGSPSNLFSEIALSKGAKRAKNFDVGYLKGNHLYDLIISFHCFEHIFDPSETLTAILGSLKNNGYVCIVVPDATRYLDYYYGPYSNFDIEHINHFSLFSLFKLLELNKIKSDIYNFSERIGNANLIYPEILIMGQKKDVDKSIDLSLLKMKQTKIISLLDKSDNDLNLTMQEFKKIIFGSKDTKKIVYVFYGLGSYAFRFINYIEKEKLLNKIDFYADSDDKLSNFNFDEKKIFNKHNFYTYATQNFTNGIETNVFIAAINARQIELMLNKDLLSMVNIFVLPPNCENRKEE